MGEQTTFALKSFSAYLLITVFSSIYFLWGQILQGAFGIFDYALYALLLISFFLLAIDNVFGFIIPAIYYLYVLFNPFGYFGMKIGSFFTLFSVKPELMVVAFTMFVLCCLLLFIVIALIFMHAFKQRNFVIELIFGIYIILFCVIVNTGFLSSLFFSGFNAGQLILPGVFLLSFVIMFVIGYFISGRKK